MDHAMQKEELIYIETIIEMLIEAYLEPTTTFPWFVAFSNGKDSTTLGYCVWKAVERVPAEERKRKVFFATSDTLLEHPQMRDLMTFSYENMNAVAAEQQLPIQAFLVRPKMTAVMKMIGHGNPLPTPKSTKNRWCTDLLKLRPMEALQERLILEYGAIIMMVGVRTEESTKRAASIKKYSVMGEFIFPHTEASMTDGGFYNKYMSHPIVDLTDEEVWRTITYARILPWRTKATSIRKMYEGAGECPIQVDRASSKPCGGSSRNGCMICMMTTAEDDKMLQGFIDKGEEWATPMNNLRRLIKQSLFDVRLRRPINTWRKKKMDWVNSYVQNYEQKEEEWKGAKKKKATRLAFEEQFQREQDDFARVSEGITDETKPVSQNLSVAGYTLQARIMLLKAFLHTQKVSGVLLVSDDELAYVKRVWQEEFGWVENEEDLTPAFPQYSGSLVLNPDYTVNVEDTTLPNLTVYGTVFDAETMLGMDLPNIENAKLNPPPRKRKKMTKPEELAMLTMPNPKTINWTPGIHERHEVFYIPVDWAGSEQDIVETLEKSALVSRIFLPYYWTNAETREKRWDWDKLETRSHLIYWNTVTFIVCDPSLTTREDAIAFVNRYIENGMPHMKEGYDYGAEYLRKLDAAQHQDTWRDYFMNKYQHLSPVEAKRKMLREAEDPEAIPLDVLDYAHVSIEELTIVRVMRYSPNNQEQVEQWCKGERWEQTAAAMMGGFKPHEAKHFLMVRGFLPHVLPKAVKGYAEISDDNLTKAHRLRQQGITGHAFWTHFHLAFLVKGMSPKEVAIFMVRHDYTSADVPKVLRRYMEMDHTEITFALMLKRLGMPLEKIELMFHREDWQQLTEEDVVHNLVQMEMDFGAYSA